MPPPPSDVPAVRYPTGPSGVQDTVNADRHRRSRGQGLVEFSLIVPFMLLIVLAVGDLGRMYTSAVGVEAAAREAADYGGFLGTGAWDETNGVQMAANGAEIKRRACTAAAGQTDYHEPAGTVNHADCDNPTVSWELVHPTGVANCSTVTSDQTPCRVHVTAAYTFHLLISFPPMPRTIELDRDSWFAISDLPTS
jgi:TadE-like protein